MFEHFDTPRTYGSPHEFSCPPGPTPYESALDDLVGNEGSEVMSACWAIGKQVEDDFNLDDVQTVEGFRAARERFEALVDKAYEAFDTYEAKQQAIEEVFHGPRY